MSLDDIVLEFFSSEEISKLQSRFSKQSDINTLLLDSAIKLQEVSDLFQVPFENVKKCFMRDKRFLYIDFEFKLQEAQEVYRQKKPSRIVQAVLKQPNFLRSNHQRVIRDKEDLSKYILGNCFSPTTHRDLILLNPHIICYTKERDLASIEVGEETKIDFNSPTIEVLNHIRKSPRVKTADASYSLSQARELLGNKNFEMPEMYQKIARKYSSSSQKRKLQAA